MKKAKTRKIGTRVVLLTAGILTVILMAAFAVIIITSAQTSEQNMDESTAELAEFDAASVESLLEEPLYMARAIAQSMQGFEEMGIKYRRNFFNNMMRSVLEENPNYLGVWSCWEPNELDNLDDSYANTTSSDSTGRYIPYYYWADGKVAFTPLTDYETEGAGDYHLLAKNSGQETILEPYEYEIDGKKVMLTTVSVPIKDKTGKIVGVVGIDLALSDLQSTGLRNGGLETAKTYVLSNNGVYVISPDGEAVGTSISSGGQADSGDILSAIAAGQGYRNDSISQATGEPVKVVYAPVTIGKTTTPWSVAIEVDQAEYMASTNQTMILLIIILAVLLAVIVVALLLIVRFSISKPVKETAAFAKALASGDLDAPVTIKAYDEIGQLKSTLDQEVRTAFRNIVKAQTKSEKQSRYQSEQTDKLVVNLERLANGELLCDMAVSEADEDTQELYTLFTGISDNLHASVHSIKAYIEEISQVLGEMSDGNLSVGISSEYKGDFVELKESINRIAASLSEVLGEINIAAEQVASGTMQVSGGSQQISQGATEQASAIEELSSSVMEIAEQTRRNALNANQASDISDNAKSGAAAGNEKMQAMIAAMDDISESSMGISKIIRVIDDIAFQTNILALNAAVEAARAGVHGKGFAVVAEEVRTLAARSANAAKETTALIESSVKKSEIGTKIANETAEALAGILQGVEETARLVSDIAKASDEQASGVVQINKGLEQMNQVVQTNSATAEEAAAAAEELSSQAELLKKMVERFRLKEENTAVESPEERTGASESTSSKPAHIRLTDTEFGKY